MNNFNEDDDLLKQFQELDEIEELENMMEEPREINLDVNSTCHCSKPDHYNYTCRNCTAPVEITLEDTKEGEDEFLRGYDEADNAIQNQLPGCNDLSQGNTLWDRGWNTRIELQRMGKFDKS